MKNDRGEVTFDADEQKKVDEIVEDRLARDRKSRPPEKVVENPADYDDLKALDSTVAKLFPNMTPKQRAEKIAQQIVESEARARAQQNGTSFEQELASSSSEKRLAAVEAELQAKNENERKQREEAESKRKGEETAQKTVSNFEEKYPDVDWKKLYDDPKFMKVARGRPVTETSLIEAYEDYKDIVGEAETAGFMRAMDKKDRSTGGGKSKEGGDYALTAEEKKSLDEWNKRYPEMRMDAKEYKERNGR